MNNQLKIRLSRLWEAFLMSLEHYILLCMWLVTTAMLLIFIPKGRIREAIVIFLFKQLITWLIGLMVVELRLIEYPVRIFSYANKTSFYFEFYVYPAICVVFNLHYPKNRRIIRQALYYIYFCTGITIIEVLVEQYTDVVTYLNWHWTVTWVTLFITFYITREFYLWFFRLGKRG